MSAPFFTVERPADPQRGVLGRYTFTLNDQFVKGIFDHHSPIYHAFPGRQRSYPDHPFGNRPPHSAIAGVKPLNKKIEDSLFHPFRKALGHHPDFGSGRATVTWEANGHPNEKWSFRGTFSENLRGTLFRSVGAILQFLPKEYEIAIADQDDEAQTTLRVITSSSVEAGHQRDSRVIMVIELVPWLIEPRLGDAMRPTLGSTADELLKLPEWDREAPECLDIALQRLGLAIRAHNAPVGVLYNGCDIIVLERDFAYDMARYRQLTNAIRAQAQPVTSVVIMDLQLKTWSTGFSHPGDPDGARQWCQTANPAACFAALAWYSLLRLQARPKALDDANLNRTIDAYLRLIGSCPCSRTKTALQPDGESRQPNTSRFFAAKIAYPRSVADMLLAVESTLADPSEAPTSRISDTETSAKGQKDWLIAMGTLTCPYDTSRTYLLVANARAAKLSRVAAVCQATLHIVTDMREATAAGEALKAALRVVSHEADPHAGSDARHRHTVEPNHLYLASEQVVDEVLDHLYYYGEAQEVFCQDVVLKLPNLFFEHMAVHFKGLLSRERGEATDALSPCDSLLCRCPLGLCKAASPTCVEDFHAYQEAGLQHHIREVTLAFKVEKAALYVLDQQLSRRSSREIPATPILNLKLSVRMAQSRLGSTWPLLAPLFEQKWPVFLDAGVVLDEVFQYADNIRRREEGYWEPDHQIPFYELPNDEEACEEIFSYLANKPEHLTEIRAGLESCLPEFYSRGFLPGYIGAYDVSLGFYDHRTLELFRCQTPSSWRRATHDPEKPLARLTHMDTYGFTGDLASLEAAVLPTGSEILATNTRDLLVFDSEINSFTADWGEVGYAARIPPSAAPVAVPDSEVGTPEPRIGPPRGPLSW